MVKINGESLDFAGKSREEFFKMTEYDSARIAIERNGDNVPKSHSGETTLAEGDCVEVVSFVGGG